MLSAQQYVASHPSPPAARLAWPRARHALDTLRVMDTMSQVRAPLAWQTLDFPTLGMSVGARLQLLADRTATATHHTFLIGYKSGHHLVTDPPLPQPGADRRLLEVGQPIRVRWFSGTALAELESAVVAIYRSPINEMHLAWPEQVRAMPIRATPRVRVDVPVDVTVAGNTVQAPLRDLSLEGASFAAEAPVADVGTSLRLAFTLPLAPDDEVRIEVDAQLRAIRRAPGSDAPAVHVHGLKFEGLTRLDSFALRAYLATRPIDRTTA